MLSFLAAKLRIQVHPDHFRIARAASVVLLFTVLAKLAVAGRDVALAWRFGRSPEVDAYNLAHTVVTWLPITLTSIMTVVFVPALVKLRAASEQDRHRFLSELNGTGVLLGLSLLVITLLGIQPLLSFFSRGFDPVTVGLAEAALVGLSPLVPLLIMVAVLVTRLQATQNHKYVLAEGVPSICLMAAVLLSPLSSLLPLIAGLVVGTILHVIWLSRQAVEAQGGSVGVSINFQSEAWSALGRFALIMGVGQLVFSFSAPLDQYFAGLQGSGSIATIGYANRLIALVMALAAMVISRATLPIFSEGIALGQELRVRRTAAVWSLLLLLLGFLVAGVMWWLSEPIVSIAFQRGAFSVEDTRAVSSALGWGVWQLPFYLAGLVLVSFLASRRGYLAISLVACLSVLAKWVALQLSVDELGLNAVMMSSVVMYGCSFLLCSLASIRSFRWSS